MDDKLNLSYCLCNILIHLKTFI